MVATIEREGRLEIEVEEKEGYRIVTPVGELDIYTVPLFRKVVLKLEGDRRHDLILDLTRVTFIDSSGLGSLIEIFQKVQSARGAEHGHFAFSSVCRHKALERLPVALNLLIQGRIIASGVYPGQCIRYSRVVPLQPLK